jgi:hypothetical protein
VAPPSSEYWNLETATSSVADRFSVCGAVIRQLLLPFGAAENVAGASTGAAESAAPAGDTLTTIVSRAPRTATQPSVRRPAILCRCRCMLLLSLRPVAASLAWPQQAAGAWKLSVGRTIPPPLVDVKQK